MKYLKFFKTEADYNVYVKRGMTIPNISYIKEGDIIKYYYVDCKLHKYTC